MQNKMSFLSCVSNGKITSGLAVMSLFSLSVFTNPVQAQSQFSEKAVALIQSCDSSQVSGFATLKENESSEGVKEIDVYMQVNGLSSGNHAVHIHQTASCTPCGSAAGHFDPGNFGMTNPDANHPYHSGDLINIDSNGSQGRMSTQTSRVTLSDGPLSLFDADGSAFIIHTNSDTYCSGGEVAGCAGGSRAACGIIKRVNSVDDFELMVSRSRSRYNAVELANAELYNDAYIFLSPVYPNSSVQSVTFYLNGNVFKTESREPFDFNGTQYNNYSGRFETDRIQDGIHTISAEIKLYSGESTFVSSQLRIGNNSSKFMNGS